MALKVTKQQAKIYQLRLDGSEADVVKPARAPRNNEEEREQALLFQRRDDYQGEYPILEYLFSTLNGVYLPPALKKRVSASGLTKGVLDIMLNCERVDADGQQWNGLAMDMKAWKGRPTPEQLAFASHLARQHWRVYFPVGSLEAWHILCCYLGIAGRDHVAADMEARSEYLRLLAGG